MIVNGVNLSIHRGEDFTIDFKFTNKDDSPFIVSSDMVHPYYLVSVVSDTFDTQNTYEYNVWCDLRTSYRFKNTRVVSKTGAINSWTEPSDFSDYQSIGVDGLIYYNRCVFYSTITKKYYVYKYITDSTTGYVECEDINMNRLTVNFPTSVTSLWVGKNYKYSISLVETDETVTSTTESPVIRSSIPMMDQGTIYVADSVGGNN